MHIHLAESPQDVARCFPVMAQLRPHLAGEQAFVEQVQRQSAQGFHLAFVEDEGDVVAVAGFRDMENLSSGPHVYVDDLVTDGTVRSNGYGAALIEWLADYARARGCTSLQLDSGVQRFDAHRFYFRQGMYITNYHFTLKGERFQK